MNRQKKLILWFKEISIKDVPLVGGKNASLGEMYRELTGKGVHPVKSRKAGIPLHPIKSCQEQFNRAGAELFNRVNIPNGFATTSEAYWQFLKQSSIVGQRSLGQAIKEVLRDLDTYNIKNLSERGKRVRNLILSAEFPEDFKEEIIKFYRKLCQEYGKENLDVAVRSSATAEDIPTASFAGAQESFLNIRGEEQVLKAVKECIASLFTDRAISYREDMGFDHLKVALSVGIQKMVRSDLACSGVMFSCDTESGFPDVVLINASYGLGENIVKGRVNPDQFYVFETTLKKGFKPIIGKALGTKEVKLIYGKPFGNAQGKSKQTTKNVSVPIKDRQKFSLADEEILNLAKWSCLIEEHYKRPMDCEWAKDGKDGKIYILQARPETVQSRRNISILEEFVLNKSKVKKIKVLLTGLSVGNKIGQGKVNRIMDVKDIYKFRKGEILVTKMTDPDWEPAMKLASAIITDLGGRTAHAAIVSRELGIPCVVGTGNVTKILKTGQEVTVSCAEGEEGKVYQGLIPFEIKKTDLKNFKKPKTKIMMNVGEPDMAFGLSFIPNEGVGLAREEFIINNSIKIHPLALINYKNQNSKIKKQIDNLTFGYKDKKQFYIDKLAEGIGKIAAAFYPKDVIVRFSDFKTNEYRALVGGEIYEPEEVNPMLGWRGASRYYDPKFKEAFILEILALKKAREEFGLDNIIPMVPFCRTVEEGKKVLKIIRQYLPDKSLKVYVMCEIPSNVILADDFLEIFDGFSIGSNDLTQLVLGLDRDSSLIASVGNEKDLAVKELVRQVIKKCREKKKYIGICGQAPSDFPDFAEFLVGEKIESISLNPDSVLKTTIKILEKEKKII